LRWYSGSRQFIIWQFRPMHLSNASRSPFHTSVTGCLWNSSPRMIPNHISYNLPVRIYSRTTRENSLTWCLLDISIPGIDINYTQHSVLHISWIGTRFDLKYLSRIHPYLFATFPVLALFSVNAGEFEEELILRALLLTILAAGVFHFTARLFLGEWILASILTTSLLLFFFSYGHIYEFMKNWHLGDWVIGRHRFLLSPSSRYRRIFTCFPGFNGGFPHCGPNIFTCRLHVQQKSSTKILL